MCEWYSSTRDICLNLHCPAFMCQCSVIARQDFCRYNTSKTRVKEMPWADELAAEKERNRWYE